jgi:cell division protease FtsH
MIELEKLLRSFNGKESIQFLKKVISLSSKPIERDFSKSLIFVMGNLDEAYTMSNNYNVDINADDFHKASLKITVSKIKNALKSRFRHEQIARLGNIHVIYPALSENAYKKIITKEIEVIQKKIFVVTGIKLNFKTSVTDLVYEEGVYPTQGVRPVFTTVNHLVRNRVTSLLTTILNENLKATSVDIHFENQRFLRCVYKQNKKIIFTEQINISSELKKLNINKKDDMQSIVAVHESGHAIISAILLKTIPKYIYSSTIDNDVNGFVFSEFKWKYISKKEILLRVALFLGGLAAEQIIYGKENVTNGCSSDLKKATNLVLKVLKKEGFGQSKLSYEVQNIFHNFYFNNSNEIEKEAEEIINKGFELALKTLNKEKKLLLELSNYLSDHPFIKQKELEIIINKFISKKVSFITDGSNLFYRNHLKKTYKELKTNSIISESTAICLNKDIV